MKARSELRKPLWYDLKMRKCCPVYYHLLGFQALGGDSLAPHFVGPWLFLILWRQFRFPLLPCWLLEVCFLTLTVLCFLGHSCSGRCVLFRTFEQAVHRVAQSWTQLQWLSTHTHLTWRDLHQPAILNWRCGRSQSIREPWWCPQISDDNCVSDPRHDSRGSQLGPTQSAELWATVWLLVVILRH